MVFLGLGGNWFHNNDSPSNEFPTRDGRVVGARAATGFCAQSAAILSPLVHVAGKHQYPLANADKIESIRAFPIFTAAVIA